VYRARDTRLDRDVAIKVLPAALADNAERLARFEREAKVLAALNHPNIAAIYGFEDGAIVMELVEGPTLADRIKSRPLPLDQALAIACQIADALEAAHEKGIVHRDLKPANIKLTPESAVKVLDFGLAAMAQDEIPASSLATTLTVSPSRTGIIMGTAAYMSPEQARGQKVDRRADIWAFGVVLFEMLAGRQLFRGETISDTLAAVLRETPDWERVPSEVRRLLRACLDKDPKRRLQAIGDWRLLLLQSAPAEPSATRWWPWTLAAALGLALAIAGAGWWRAARPVAHPLIRMSAELASGPGNAYHLDETVVVARQPGTFLALSPDGVRFALRVFDLVGRKALASRRLGEARFTPIRGTDNPTSPFFSPDGQWIAFFGDGKLRKIPVQGGAPVVLCNSENFPSGSWGDDGNIIAALRTQGGLSRLPSAGGDPVPVTELKNGEIMHRWPHVLHGSQAVLFTAYTGGGPENANIVAVSLKTRARKTLVRGGEMARYVVAANGAGYLIYLHQNVLFAAPFDADNLAVTGIAQPILDDVSGIAATTKDFDISQNGTFVYISGEGEQERSIFWLDQSGKTEPLHPAPGFYNGLRFSPDGKRLVFGMGSDLSQENLWVQDLERNTSVRLTSLPGASHSPVWFPDGKHILFMASNQPNPGIYWIPSDGGGQPAQLASLRLAYPSSFAPDARTLAFADGNPFTGMKVWTAPIEGRSEQVRLGKTEPFVQALGFPMPAFSPDGHWLAYASAETGTSEIYVQPYPGPGGKIPISSGGGQFAVWSPDGRELFFIGPNGDGKPVVMVTDYRTKGGSFSPGKPRIWPQHQILFKETGGPFQPYALAPDGKRFAVLLYPDATTERRNRLHLTFLFNFSDELRRRVAEK
jgi:serine/threonine-protein kinase